MIRRRPRSVRGSFQNPLLERRFTALRYHVGWIWHVYVDGYMFCELLILSQRVRWDDWSSARSNYVTSAEDCETSMWLLAGSTKLKTVQIVGRSADTPSAPALTCCEPPIYSGFFSPPFQSVRREQISRVFGSPLALYPRVHPIDSVGCHSRIATTERRITQQHRAPIVFHLGVGC